ncbi:hypothetical protein GQ600_12501 [Phytophthora cactorum]|nr:hypothetical protein GQ600_12501 [Phytophthora cactorum]
MQTTPAASAPAGGAGGMPDLSNLASMLGGGGGGGLADLMNNPQMMEMAQNMMQNPQMMQMAQNMMQNPDMLNNLMVDLAVLAALLLMLLLAVLEALIAARSDPELAGFFRDVDSEGPSAAMRHMSNPKVSQLMQNVMSRMQG